ncbi:MAG: thiamine diphosphokinase [Anaerolineae bacterium]|nr:thiamine diphosphokinase [Anaerolineae bacterium]
MPASPVSNTASNAAGHVTRALVFANGDLNDGPAVRAALRYAADALIVAADGGARLALACDLKPDVVVGDMDSLTADDRAILEALGAVFERHPAAKDETDLELALLAAVTRQAAWIRVIGAVGDRLDQTFANVYLLALRELAGQDVRLVAGRQTLWLIGPGSHPLHGAPGDTISLIPLAGDAVGVETGGLVYPLRDETLRFGPARGISNVMDADEAYVSLAAGTLIVVHTPGRA